MNYSNYRISLDIRDTAAQASVSLKCGDTGVKITAVLSEGGVPYEISNDCYAVFSAKKADGTEICNNCVIQNNAVIYEVTAQTVAAVGRVDCEFVLYDANGKQITAPRFSIFIYDTLISGGSADSKSEYNTLSGLITEAKGVLDDFKAPSATASSVDAGTNPDVDVTLTEESGLKFNFKIPKGERGIQGPAGSAYSMSLNGSGVVTLNAQENGSATGTYIKGFYIGGAIKKVDYASLANLPSANKAMTVQTDGTQVFTFDGSAAKTLNIKAGTNIALSSDASGNITINAQDGVVLYEPAAASTGLYCDGSTTATDVNSATLSDPNGVYKRLKIYVSSVYGLASTEMPIDRTHSATNPYGNRIGGIIFPSGDHSNGATLNYLTKIHWCVKFTENVGWTFQVTDSGWVNLGTGAISQTDYTDNKSIAATNVAPTWNQRHNSGYAVYKIIGYTV